MTCQNVKDDSLMYAVSGNPCVGSVYGGQEELAAVNLAKYRKVQHDLEEAEGRAEAAENALARTRTSSRSSVSASRVLHFAFFFYVMCEPIWY